MALSISNLKKHLSVKPITLSFSVSALLFTSTIFVSAKANSNENFKHILPSIQYLLSEESCGVLAIDGVTANGNQGSNIPSNVLDKDISTRWSSDAANTNVLPFGVGILTLELPSLSTVSSINIAFLKSDERTTSYSVESSTDNINWVEIIPPTSSQISSESILQENSINNTSARYIRIIGTGNSVDGVFNSAFTSITEVELNGCGILEEPSNFISPPPVLGSSDSDPDFGLDPNLEPWENFNLTDWALDAPNADTDGLSARTSDEDFINGNLFSGSEPFFFTAADGGMVFKSPVDGARTSANTSFPRSELREMLRAGADGVSTQGVNENNWVLGYQPTNLDLGADTSGAQDNIPTSVGGRNGNLRVTMRVNRVTVSGSSSHRGRVIIGQIHADDDEPLRLYYRKLPNNSLGSIYFTHEIRQDRVGDPNDGRNGDDLDDVDLVGSSSSNASQSDVSDGIALGELFSYEIINQGSLITVVLRRGDQDAAIIAQESFDMNTTVEPSSGIVGSGYDRDDEWMYFKAGAYTQNNSGDTTGHGENGDEADFDQVTIYRLDNTHD